MNELTQVLSANEQGQPQAAEQLLPLVYDELRKLAAAKLAREKPGQTLQVTALVHEAYVRLVEGEHRGVSPTCPDDASRDGQHWDSRGHFFAAAAEAMRRILVENARRKRSQKHGGRLRRHALDDVDLAEPEPDDELLALDEALARLAAKDPLKAELVKLRHFAGLTIEETAQALNISVTTANRYWAYARAWLHQEMLSDAASRETGCSLPEKKR